MKHKWQMQEARARFAELVRRAYSDGPQIVTYQGVDTAVVVSIDDYQRLDAARPNFIEHLLSGPKIADEFVDLINERAKDAG